MNKCTNSGTVIEYCVTETLRRLAIFGCVTVLFAFLGCDMRSEEQKCADEARQYYDKGKELLLQGDYEASADEFREAAAMGNDQAVDELVRMTAEGYIAKGEDYRFLAAYSSALDRYEAAAKAGDVAAMRILSKIILRKTINDSKYTFAGLGFVERYEMNVRSFQKAYDYMAKIVAKESNADDKKFLKLIAEKTKEYESDMCVGLRKMANNFEEIKKACVEWEKSEKR